MAKKPIKGNFTDGAKRRAGVQVSSFEAEMAKVKAAHDIAESNLKHRITGLEDGVRQASAALDEGRRGDCARILRGLLPQNPKPPSPSSPPEPRTA